MKQAKKWPAPVALDGEGAQAVELDGERVSVSPSTVYVNRSTQAAQRAQLAERRRTEQQCRDYWRRMYGTRAEIASRGGVSWVGGVRRV